MSEVDVSGSCLCGEVRYSAKGGARNFFHCYCSRCRKATGSGRASNIIMAPAEITFTAGESNVREFQPPDAKFFTNAFCKKCGSRLPRFSPERNIAIVPAGSLDEDPGISPTGRIFKAFAADWSCDGSDIPTHAEYPPKP